MSIFFPYKEWNCMTIKKENMNMNKMYYHRKQKHSLSDYTLNTMQFKEKQTHWKTIYNKFIWFNQYTVVQSIINHFTLSVEVIYFLWKTVLPVWTDYITN